MTSAELQIMFDGFNEIFFGNRISPLIRAKFVKKLPPTKAGPADAQWHPQTGEIWIDEIYARSENVTCVLLLHEMAHAVLDRTYIGHPTKNPGHGMIYQAEIYRLFMAGAYDDLL